MRIDKISLDRIYKPRTPIVACIGFFDGVHKGHQKLIQTTIELAQQQNCASALITFEPDPWVTIKRIPLSACEHLTTTRQKINIVIKQGIQNVYLLDFTADMACLEPKDFVYRILGQLNLKGLVCGFDFHFGARGAGNTELMKQLLPCPVTVVDEVTMEGEKVSSTRIVECVKRGDFLAAYNLLGYPFTVDGKVVEGNRIGTSLGFPTANISISEEYVLPRLGVYSAHVSVRGKYYGAMVNIGHNPTLNYTDHVSMEANLFDFSGNLYGETVSVILEQYIREEKQFKNKENLIMQLGQDRTQAARALGIQ